MQRKWKKNSMVELKKKKEKKKKKKKCSHIKESII